MRAPDDQIYHRTERTIQPGEDQRFWLSPPMHQENAEGRQSVCPHSNENFQFPLALSAHNATGCQKIGSKPNQDTTLTEFSYNLDEKGISPPKMCHYVQRNRQLEQANNSNDEENGFEFSNSIWKRGRLEELKFDLWRNVSQQRRENKERSEGGVCGSRIFSNPKLASLISSFAWPRIRRMNESQSLAEYHKQEFRRKFQGNEHYLRRHLYRENAGRKSPSRRSPSAASLDEEGASSLQTRNQKLRVKEENEKFPGCLGEARAQANKRIFELSRKNTGDSFQRMDNGTLEGSSRIAIETASREVPYVKSLEEPAIALLNRGIARGQHVDQEHFVRDTTYECTCQQFERDIHKLPCSLTNVKEDLITEKDDGKSFPKRIRGEHNQTDSLSTELKDYQKHSESSSIGSHVYQKVHQIDTMSLEEQQPCCCFPTSSPTYSSNGSIARYHEPAFCMELLYRYSAYPRMLPFVAHQVPNSPQAIPRSQGFTCEFCGKVYCRKYVLKIHMRTHTGFKPLRCKVCQKSFSDPSNMKKHVKLHETEDTVHECRQCGRNFVRYRGLLNHIKSKHMEPAHTAVL